ncbi:hypothetical protein [Streptomyces sp. NPDC059072]|uniref:hypothetical protein n=1 Tax=Streptomyces sp. NPDC059072 TaxID=3346715 RepID=UPI0036AE2354
MRAGPEFQPTGPPGIVLAGILADRKMRHTTTGRLAPASAVSIDAVTWVLPALAVGLPPGRDGFATALAVLAVGAPAAAATQRFGLTDVFGAVLVGLALPADGERGPWTAAAGALGRAGPRLLPVLFVVPGTTLAAGPETVLDWRALLYATATARCGPLLWAVDRRAADPPDRPDFAPALPNHPLKRTSRG